ncbi:DNA-binding protein RFX6 like protein [Argiope bruennichi]|uniref:DNA-binding protein RFX6 like protein n=1 Tax=Argiope bruennichi TaxID=94029 RepID=A0A8T0FXJ3_ARGBR|nr:DNA-binding protein RFX6 like protein [Argiope bruennichi]
MLKYISHKISRLKLNYCSCPEVCLPREIIYEHYLEFCRNEKIPPACKATFGKLIRNTFPDVTSKRLGARGHSKYHYNGIGIKQNSEYSNTTSAKVGITRFSSCVLNKKELGSPKKFSLTSKTGTLLPNFPDVSDLLITNLDLKEKLRIFLTMYKMHCQCIVDITISGNFEEIQLFLLHFWQGFPDHLISIFEQPITLDLGTSCDLTLTDILLPSDMMEIPERLLREIQNIALHWRKWLECSLENMPSQLKELKMKQGKAFCNTLKRYVAFLHLSQVALPALNKFPRLSLSRELNQIEEQQTLHDWLLNIDIYVIKYLLPASDDKAQIIHWLQSLLESESFIEKLITWLDELIRRIIENKKEVMENARCFILQLMYLLNKISYWLTQKESNNFTLLQEYLLLAFESQQYQEEENVLYTKLKKHLNTTVYNTDYFKSPTSCFLVTSKKELNSRQKSKEKVLNDVSLYGVQSNLKWKQSNESSNPMVPSRHQNNVWKTDYLTSKFPETSFFKNDVCHPEFSFQQIPSEFNNRDYSAANISHKFQHHVP